MHSIDTAALKSAHFTIAPAEPADFAQALPMLMDPKRTALFWPEPYSVQQAARWMEARTTWAVKLCFSDDVFALGFSEPTDSTGTFAIHAIVVNRPKIAVPPNRTIEAGRLFVAVVFDRCGARRIVATPIVDNIPAVRLTEGIGFKREGELRQAIFINGKYRNVALFSMLREEFVCLQQ